MSEGGTETRLRAVAVVVALAVLHFLLQPLLARWWGSPHLAAGAVVVAGTRLRPGAAAVTGFGVGLLEEAMLLAGPGPLAAAYALGGYVAARAWTLFFTDTRFILPVYIVSGVWVLIIVNTLLAPHDLTWTFMVLKAPVVAVLTAVVALPAVWSASGRE